MVPPHQAKFVSAWRRNQGAMARALPKIYGNAPGLAFAGEVKPIGDREQD